MADGLFCLDIHKDTAVAVVVDQSSKVSIVTACGFVETEERSLTDAIVQLKEQTGFKGGRSLVTLGAELFSFRNLSLPFSDRKKIEQVLPFELEDLSPLDLNNLLVDFIVSRVSPEGSDIVAAMISREYLADCLESLSAAGINPDGIGISGLSTALKIADSEKENFLLIDVGTNWATLFVVSKGQVALVRSLAVHPEATEKSLVDGAFVLRVKQTLLASQLLDMRSPEYCVYLSGSCIEQTTLLSALSSTLSSNLGGVEVHSYQQSGQPFIKIDPEINNLYEPGLMDRILVSALTGGKKAEGVNFRKNDFRKKKSLQEYRRLLLQAAIPILVVCVGFIGYMGYNYSNLKAEHQQLRSQVNEVFQETLPEVTRIVNPVQQLQVTNNEIRATYGPGGNSGGAYTIIELLTELSARIPSSYTVKVVRLVADMDTLRLKGVTGDFNTVDNVQKELGKSTYFNDVTISSANQSPKDNEVNFELKLDLARQ